MNRLVFRVTPVEGVSTRERMWHHPALDVTVSAPPQGITAHSSRTEVNAALRAAESGLASLVPNRPADPNRLLLWVQTGAGIVLSMTLPTGAVASCRAASLAMLTRHWPAHLAGFGFAALGWFGDQSVVMVLALLWEIAMCSFTCHELGHIVAFRLLRPNADAVFVVSLTHCHLIRRSLPLGPDVAVTVCGPFASLAPAILSTPWLTNQPVLWGGGLVIGLAQVAALLLPTGDGTALRQAMIEAVSTK